MSLIVGTEDWDDCERRQLWLSGTLCGGGTAATAWRISAYFSALNEADRAASLLRPDPV
jgi:hypothetical protein